MTLHQLLMIKGLIKASGANDIETVLVTETMTDSERKRAITIFTNKMMNDPSANIAFIAVRY